MGLRDVWTYLTTDPKKAPPGQRRIKLTYSVVLFILINSILGSSLFYLPSLGVISSGAASIIAWIALFIIASLIMLYIGELVALHPSSGGTYEYCKRAYGRFGSFMAGWLIWIAGNFGMALNIVAASQYFIPQQTQFAFLMRIGFAVIWIIVLNFMAFRGVDAGATMLVVFGMIATFVLAFMTIPSFIDIPALFSGHFNVPFEMMQPFFQHEGLSIISFLGFEVITYMSDEVEKPQELHKVLKTGILICGVIMVIYVLASLGTVSYSDYVKDARPFAVQALNTMGPIGEQIVVFGMYLVIIGAAAAWPITGSRLIQAMSKDNLFIKHFAKKHEKHNTPYRAVMFQTLAVFLFAWFIFRGEMVNWGDSYRTFYLIYVVLSLIVLSMIILTVPILRKKEKDLVRPYTAPFGRFVPYLLVALFIVLILNWIKIEGGNATSTLRLASSFIILGLPFYFFVEMLYSESSIVKINEYLIYFFLLGDKMFFPVSIKNKIFKGLGDMRNKVVLEFGCSVGTLTKKLAPMVLPSGRIYATDLSLKKAKIANKRTSKFEHVAIAHHPHLDDFKLEMPEQVDEVISIGMLSYMQNPKQILTKLGAHVKKGGRVVFVDYDKFFFVIPNAHWIQNHELLIAMFKEAGFNVQVTVKRSIFWQHIIISGYKI
jgi:APA family basic amino acid/polyamine antiporter